MLDSLVARTLGVAPVRLALATVVGGVAAAVGNAAATWLAFAVGTFACFFLALGDPRRPFRQLETAPEAAPADARVAPARDVIVRALFPSTITVTALAAVSLPFQATLAALLAGIVAGLGLAGALTGALVATKRLYVARGTRRVYSL